MSTVTILGSRGETDVPEDDLILGTDFTFAVDLTSDGSPTGTAVALTGYALQFVLRRPNATETDIPLLSKTTGGGGITIGDGSGTDDRASIAIARADHLDIGPGWAEWALWRTDTNRVLASGRVFLTARPRQV